MKAFPALRAVVVSCALILVAAACASGHAAAAQESGPVAVARVYVCPAGYSSRVDDPYVDCPFLVTDTYGVTGGDSYRSDEAGVLVLPVTIDGQGRFQFVVRIDYDEDGESDYIIDAVARYCSSGDGPVEDVAPGDTQIPFPFAILQIETDLDLTCDFFVDPITDDSPLAQLAAGPDDGPVVTLPDTGAGPTRDDAHLFLTLVGLGSALLAGSTLIAGWNRRVDR